MLSTYCQRYHEEHNTSSLLYSLAKVCCAKGEGWVGNWKDSLPGEPYAFHPTDRWAALTELMSMPRKTRRLKKIKVYLLMRAGRIENQAPKQIRTTKPKAEPQEAFDGPPR